MDDFDPRKPVTFAVAENLVEGGKEVGGAGKLY